MGIRSAHFTLVMVLLLTLLALNVNASPNAKPDSLSVADTEEEGVDIRYADGSTDHRRISKKATMMAACTGEYHLCRNFPRRTTGDIWACLFELADYIENKRCYDFITGFFTCQKDISDEDECASVMPEWSIGVHHCLRVKSPSTISAECKATAYYKFCRHDLQDNETSQT